MLRLVRGGLPLWLLPPLPGRCLAWTPPSLSEALEASEEPRSRLALLPSTCLGGERFTGVSSVLPARPHSNMEVGSKHQVRLAESWPQNSENAKYFAAVDGSSSHRSRNKPVFRAWMMRECGSMMSRSVLYSPVWLTSTVAPWPSSASVPLAAGASSEAGGGAGQRQSLSDSSKGLAGLASAAAAPASRGQLSSEASRGKSKGDAAAKGLGGAWAAGRGCLVAASAEVAANGFGGGPAAKGPGGGPAAKGFGGGTFDSCSWSSAESRRLLGRRRASELRRATCLRLPSLLLGKGLLGASAKGLGEAKGLGGGVAGAAPGVTSWQQAPAGAA